MTSHITANLITLNEESNLPACLDSLRFVDEVVVVDGGSHDRTVEIALQSGAVVIERPFDDFANQRNRAIQISTGDWILSIDADERVPIELSRELRRAADTASDATAGFWMPIESRLFGRRFRFSGTQGERKMRLFRRGRGRWRGRVHETVLLDGDAGRLRHAIEHRSTPDFATYLRKFERYSAFEADQLVASGRANSWWRPWIEPLWTFTKLYVAKLGVLDGPAGLCFCGLSGWQTWVAYRIARARRARTKQLFKARDCRHEPIIART